MDVLVTLGKNMNEHIFPKCRAVPSNTFLALFDISAQLTESICMLECVWALNNKPL